MTVIFLSMISYVFFYGSAFNIIKDSIIREGHKELSMFSMDMERNMYDIYKLIYNAKNDPTLTSIDSKKKIDHFDYMMIKKYILQALAEYPYIDNILFYDKQNSLTISQQGVFTISELFPMFLSNNEKNEFFWNEYLNKPNQSDTFPKSDFFQQDVYYSENLVDSGSRVSKELSIVAAEHNLFKNLRLLLFLDAQKMSEQYGNNTVVVDPNTGKIFFYNANIDVNIQDILVEISNESFTSKDILYLENPDSYIFYAKSPNYDWYYLKFISHEKVFAKIKAFNQLALLVIVSLFFSSFLLSYFFSFKLYRPIKRLTDLVEKSSQMMAENFNSITNSGNSNEIQKIYYYLMYVNNNYEALERKFNMIQGIYKELFYVKLIKGNETEINENIIKELNIDPRDFNNCVIINYTLNFKPEFYKLSQSEDQLNKINLSVKEIIDIVLKNMNINCYSFQITPESCIAILPLANRDFDLSEFKTRVNSILKNDDDILYVNFAVSRVYHGLRELKSAYNEAIKLADYYSIKMETQFITIETVKKARQQKIPQKLYVKIRSVIKLMKFNDLQSSFNELAKYLEEKGIPLIYIKKGLITMFNDVLEKIGADESFDPERIDNIYKDIDSMHSIEDYKNITERICQVCYSVLDQVEEDVCRHDVVDDMVNFIRENYGEDICLDLFAEKYRMSPIYLSKLFKEFKGVNYTDYLNEIRMEKAQEFLLNTDIKVKDISQKIGYKDSNAFIKAFKKCYGVSPGEYRRINILCNK